MDLDSLMDRYSLILCKKPLGPKSPKVTYVKKSQFFVGIHLKKEIAVTVVIGHLNRRQLVIGSDEEFVFCVDYKNTFFINEIMTKIKNIMDNYAELGNLKVRINHERPFIPIDVPHDVVYITDLWKERVERGRKFYKIIRYHHVQETYKDAYELSLSMVIDSIEETGFYEIQKL